MKIAILGYGREGRSLLKFLKKHLKYRGADVSILDKARGAGYLKNLSDFDIVFRSPGVPYNLPEIQRAIKNGVKFSSATKLFFDLCPAKIVGITGTKGKGTTSMLLYKILKASGKKALLAGNIGKPMLDILPKIKKDSLIVLELSSFQLQDLKKSPQVAAVTDVFPDHLDVHKNMREYVAAKSNIARYQKKSDIIFYFQDNLLSRVIAKKSPGTKIGFNGKPFGLKKNHLMASAIAARLGCPPDVIRRTVQSYEGLEHRLELARKVTLQRTWGKNKFTIYFYNDSASTNPQTAAAAVLSLSNTLNPKPCPLILIAGGKDKNLDYSPLAESIKKSGAVKEVVLFGENKFKIRSKVLGLKSKVKIRIAGNLKSAVDSAYKAAKSLFLQPLTSNLVTILFSPASASFDMFKDYADRGEQFKKLVRKLK